MCRHTHKCIRKKYQDLKNKKSKSRNTWKLESCSFVSLVVKLSTSTALLSSCNLLTEATALFLPRSFSENTKLLDKSHNSTFPSSCKVTDFTPARIRFFAARSKFKSKVLIKLAYLNFYH